MPSARRAGVPPEIIKEWEADFKQKKAEQKQTGGRKLPSGAAQYEYDGVTYTAKWTNQSKGKVGFPEAAYEARVEGARSRRGEQQKIKLGSLEQQLVDLRYKDAQRLSKYLGQKIVVDHLIPIGKGGFSNDPNNLIFLTEATNLRKSDSMDFYKLATEEFKYLSELAADLDSNVDFKGGSAALKPGRFAKPAGLAAAGVFALGPLSTAASAAETVERERIAQETQNPLDQFQAGVSKFSLGADIASYAPPAAIPATIASTGADILNLVIDGGRAFLNMKADPNRDYEEEFGDMPSL
jgi:hypothetical protein